MAVPLSPARAADRSTDGGCGALDREPDSRKTRPEKSA